jgi:hypothetical protein
VSDLWSGLAKEAVDNLLGLVSAQHLGPKDMPDGMFFLYRLTRPRRRCCNNCYSRGWSGAPSDSAGLPTLV